MEDHKGVELTMDKMTAKEATDILVEKLKIDYSDLTESDRDSVNRAINIAFISLNGEKYWDKIFEIINNYLGKKITAENAMKLIIGHYTHKLSDDYQMRT